MISAEEFSKVAAEVKCLRQMPTDEELLELYGLYKQVTVGDNNSAEPNVVNMMSTAKWSAWAKNRGMNTTIAIQRYAQKARALMAKYND